MSQNSNKDGNVDKIIELFSNNYGISISFIKSITCPSFITYCFEFSNIVGKDLQTSEVLNDIALLTAAYGASVRLTIKDKILTIEIAHDQRKKVIVSDMVEEYKKSSLNYKIPIPLGIDNENKSRYVDLYDVQGLLMAGTTGSGKSNFIHSIICSLIKLLPLDTFKLFLADVKRVEYFSYAKLSNLYAKVMVEPQEIVDNLKLLLVEKEKRLNSLDKYDSYPYMIVILDTFCDLMMSHGNEFENLIVSLAKNARSAKVILIMSDSRPSIDVFTSQIKEHFSTRLAGNTSSAIDSQVILDRTGAERLLGLGDMLYRPIDSNDLIRFQTPYISEKEIEEIVKSASKK